jgi:rhodanese-related sulfurtransferase
MTAGLVHGLILVLLAVPNAQWIQHRHKARLFARGPYCGIYSLYAAAVKLGSPVRFEDLLSTKFVSDVDGSSLNNLREAAAAAGLSAIGVAGARPEQLARHPGASVLHVRASFESKKADHWIAVLSTDGVTALVVDPPHGPRELPFAEIVARWDGVTLLLDRADRPVTVAALAHGPISILCAVLGGAAIVFGLLVRMLPRGMAQKPRGSWRPALWMILAGATLGVVAQAATGLGILAHPDVAGRLEAARSRDPFPRITLAELVRHIEGGGVVLDARLERDYFRGHVPGSINVPPAAWRETASRLRKQLPLDARIVIYCQSAGCSYSDRLGAILQQQGFSRVRVYADGWVGWNAQQAAYASQ